MLAALCAPHVPTLATHRNHNNRLGLPLTLFRLEPEHALCICELGTSEVGELADLAAIAEPDIGVITNIAPEHLEFLGDLEGVAREEAVAARARCLPTATPSLPADEPLLAPYRARRRAHDDVRRARRRRALPRLGARRATGRARCSTSSASACELTRAAARRRTTPPTSPPPPPPTLRAGLPLAGLGEGAAAIELSPFRGQEQARARRWRARERRLQRQPGLDRERAGGARRARRRRPHGRRARPHGRARARRAALARRGRARLRAPRASTSSSAWASSSAAVRDRGRGLRVALRRPTSRPPPSCCREILRPGDFVLLKGSRSAGVERLAEVAL